MTQYSSNWDVQDIARRSGTVMGTTGIEHYKRAIHRRINRESISGLESGGKLDAGSRVEIVQLHAGSYIQSIKVKWLKPGTGLGVPLLFMFSVYPIKGLGQVAKTPLTVTANGQPAIPIVGNLACKTAQAGGQASRTHMEPFALEPTQSADGAAHFDEEGHEYIECMNLPERRRAKKFLGPITAEFDTATAGLLDAVLPASCGSSSLLSIEEETFKNIVKPDGTIVDVDVVDDQNKVIIRTWTGEGGKHYNAYTSWDGTQKTYCSIGMDICGNLTDGQVDMLDLDIEIEFVNKGYEVT